MKKWFGLLALFFILLGLAYVLEYKFNEKVDELKANNAGDDNTDDVVAIPVLFSPPPDVFFQIANVQELLMEAEIVDKKLMLNKAFFPGQSSYQVYQSGLIFKTGINLVGLDVERSIRFALYSNDDKPAQLVGIIPSKTGPYSSNFISKQLAKRELVIEEKDGVNVTDISPLFPPMMKQQKLFLAWSDKPKWLLLSLAESSAQAIAGLGHVDEGEEKQQEEKFDVSLSWNNSSGEPLSAFLSEVVPGSTVSFPDGDITSLNAYFRIESNVLTAILEGEGDFTAQQQPAPNKADISSLHIGKDVLVLLPKWENKERPLPLTREQVASFLPIDLYANRFSDGFCVAGQFHNHDGVLQSKDIELALAIPTVQSIMNKHNISIEDKGSIISIHSKNCELPPTSDGQKGSYMHVVPANIPMELNPKPGQKLPVAEIGSQFTLDDKQFRNTMELRLQKGKSLSAIYDYMFSALAEVLPTSEVLDGKSKKGVDNQD